MTLTWALAIILALTMAMRSYSLARVHHLKPTYGGYADSEDLSFYQARRSTMSVKLNPHCNSINMASEVQRNNYFGSNHK